MSAPADKPPKEYRGFTYDILESDDPAVPLKFGVIVQKDGETVYLSQARSPLHAAWLAFFWIDVERLNKEAK